tara:strand:+ start:1290 stop:1463 length:174 start_codon:yes stop_codon:yes gene_type:complete
MKHYKVEVIQKHIEIYVVEADSEQEAEKLTYEGMHDWLDPSSSKYMDTKVKNIEVIK